MSTWDAVKLAARKVITRARIFFLEIQLQEEEYMLTYYRSLGDRGTLQLQCRCYDLARKIHTLKASL